MLFIKTTMTTAQYHLKPDSRALITGATGFTGSVLVRKLVEQGVDVVAIARPTSDLKSFQGLPIKWFQGDVFDPKLIEQAAQGVNYIFHMATPFREAKSPDVGYRNVHVVSTQWLAKAASQQPDFRRFVHVSTIGVHGHVEDPPGDEQCPLKPGDIYQETKLEGELWIKQFGEQTGLPVTVVRPAGIYGPGEKRLLKIYKMVMRGWVPAIGNGSNLLHFVHVDDLTNFFILAATHPQATGEVFICGSQQAICFRDMVNLIGKYYQRSPRFISLPAPPIFALGDLFEWVCRPLGIEPPIYRRRLAFYTKDRSFDTRKMQKLLNFIPSHDNKEGLLELAQWYLDNGWLTYAKGK